MSCDTCLTRRSFILRSAAALSVVSVLSACASSATSPLEGSFTVDLADHPELALVGTPVRVWAGPKTPVGVIRTSATSFGAFSLKCPHQGEIVDAIPSGPIPFACPGHGAEFHADGSWAGGMQTSALTAYRVSFDAAAGTLEISA